MAHDSNQIPPLFTHIDVSSHPSNNRSASPSVGDSEAISLLRELVRAQDRQNELLEELVQQTSSVQRQRAQSPSPDQPLSSPGIGVGVSSASCT